MVVASVLSIWCSSGYAALGAKATALSGPLRTYAMLATQADQAEDE
jgi:hypothetical protein